MKPFMEIRQIARRLSMRKYPGLGISYDVNFDIHGNFVFGAGCSVGVGANIIIPEGSTLSIGDDCYIGRYVELGSGGTIRIGSHTSLQDRCIFLGDVTLGRYCVVAPNVYISSGRHYFDRQPTALIKDQDRLVLKNMLSISAHSKTVTVEDDCWLGINVVVMAGVRIGKGAVVGANSVVTKDVAPYTVVAGMPAKELKKRLDFVPPQRIHYANQIDWPYFYSGFEMSQTSLDKYSADEGIAALNEFALCLDASSGESIHLVVKCIGSQKCGLIFAGQKKEILNQFQHIVFACDEHAKQTSRIYMRPDTASTVLIIQEAWVQ